MLFQHVVHHEAVQRHPPGDELTNRRLAALESQVTWVEAGRLYRDVGLGHEVLVTSEHFDCGRLSGLITIESKNHLTVERVMIAHQPPQQPSMIITEGGAAGGNRRIDAGQVSRHHVGVALNHDRLALFADRGASEVQSIEHVRLLVEKGFRSVDVLRRHSVVLEQPASPEAHHLPSRVADRPHRTALEEVPPRLAGQPGRYQLHIAEPSAPEMLQQGAAIARSEPDPEPLSRLPIKSSFVQELSSYDRV